MPATGAIAPLLRSPSCTLRISLSWWGPLCYCREFPNAKSETTGQPPPTRSCKLVSTQRVLKPPLCSHCHPVPFAQLAGKELGQSRATCAEKVTALQGSALAAAAGALTLLRTTRSPMVGGCSLHLTASTPHRSCPRALLPPAPLAAGEAFPPPFPSPPF